MRTEEPKSEVLLRLSDKPNGYIDLSQALAGLAHINQFVDKKY